jgi:hypothetical protein
MQLAGDECTVAQFGVTPSESVPQLAKSTAGVRRRLVGHERS